jgi:hypothetical protein
LLLLFFNIDIGLINSFVLIGLVFFTSTLIPSFALTEVVLRSAIAVYFFTPYITSTVIIVSVSITLWFINLAIPALFGSFFMWKLNIIKN